jgi:hypothetical protein
MKSTKAFFLLILLLTICIIFLDWIRHYYYGDQIISPIARLKTITLLVGGIAIMKLAFTSKGFKLFLVMYLTLWLIYWLLSFMAMHHNVYSSRFSEMFSFYTDVVPLTTPLPFIFFWFVDRLFFVEKKNNG